MKPSEAGKWIRMSAALFVLAFGGFTHLYPEGLGITLAGLYHYTPDGNSPESRDVTRDLFGELEKRETEGLIRFLRAKSLDVPKSILEAGALSERENIDLVLYGFLKEGDNYGDLEIKLYDRFSGVINKVFYAKTTMDNYDELVGVMAQRIIRYLYKTLGVEERQRRASAARGVVSVKCAGGYWLPFSPWDSSLMGIAAAGFGIHINPVDPIFSFGVFDFSLTFGISASFLPGVNRDGYEKFLLYSTKYGVPLNLFVGIHRRSRLFFQLMPGVQIDILDQERLYQGQVKKVSGAFFLSGAVGYEYMFRESGFSVGMEGVFGTAFYSQLFFTGESNVYIRYSFHKQEEGIKYE